MKRSFIILMAASALAALSCTKEVNDQTAPEKEQVTMSFDATIGAPTKVEIGSSATEDGVTTHNLNWSVGDKIKVYANGASSNEGVEFTTDITVPSATATFTGTIDADETYYAFYPSSAGAKWYKSSSNFGFTIPASQKTNGIASGFAMAKAENNELQFEHITGFVKFTIPDEYDGEIAGVTFAGNSEEVLAGYVKVFPDDASQNEFSYDNSKYTEVNLLPASGDAFSAGTYYIAVYPTEFEQGITMTFTNTDGATATKTSDISAEIVAGGILNVKTITGLSFVSAKAQELPWNEEFSGDDVLSNYVTTGTVSVAANENYATGTKPELYLNGTASFSANIDVKDASRNLTLTYKTNKSSLILSASEGVTPNKQITGDEKTYLYHIALADNVEQMTLKWESSANSRLDDIMLVEGTLSFQTLTFDKTSAAATIGKDFTEPVLSGDKTTVTYASSVPTVASVNETTGEVSVLSEGQTVITATAVGTSEYFEASASYTLIVSPSNITVLLSEEFDNSSSSDSSGAITTSTFPNFSGATSKAYKSMYGGIKLGSGSAVGYITTKNLDLSSAFTVKIDACKYGSDTGNINVSVGDQTQTISNSQLKAAGTFTTFTLSFNAATSSSAVKISTSAKRAYIDNVIISK